MPMTKAGTYKGTAEERIRKRQKDIDEIGRLSKAVESRTAKKQVEGGILKDKGQEVKKEESARLGESGKSIIHTLKSKTAIEENKYEREEKRKK